MTHGVKRSELLFNVIAVPVDFLMMFAAATLAYFLRYRVETLPVQFSLSYENYLKLAGIGIVVLLVLFALNGLYNQKSTRGFWHEAGKVGTAVSVGLMLVVVLFFFNQHLFPSRLIILMSWIFAILLVTIGRLIILLWQRHLLARGEGRHKLFVIAGQGRPQILDEIQSDPNLGYEIIAVKNFTPPILGDIEKLHRETRIDELLQADSALANDEVLQLVNLCEELGIKFNYLPGILESHRANIETDVIGSMPVIRLKSTPLDGWGKVVKRGMDITISLVGLVALLPLFLFLAVLIKLHSQGPVFFHQRRGSSFHNFEFYKFRTMHSNLSEGTPEGDRIRAALEKHNSRHGPYVKIKNDPRVTGVGRLLRKTKLDELPQLWHILRGQMSLVGPRIHMTREVEKFESQYKKIFTIKPGATGLAQINQFYNPELPFGEEVKLDLFYIENWSAWLDLYIIAKTLILLLTKPPKADY